MSTTQYTGHYNLPTFGDNPNDRPSWRGDFTDAMTKIDNQMYANATNITTATAAANNATTAASKATETANTVQSTADDAVGRLDALGATDNATAGQLKTKIDVTATELNAVKSGFSSFKTSTNENIASLQSKSTEIENSLTDITPSVHANTISITNIEANLNALHADSAANATTLYNTIQNIEANLNALHADSAANATTLYNTIQNSSRILSVNQPFVSHGSNIIVTFGDSYADTANTRSWAYMLAKKLGWTLHNYAKDGAGYIGSNTTYMSEFNTAKTDKTYNHDDVSLVVIGGSRNSIDTYSGKVKTAARELFQGVSGEYPNARIIAVPLLWDKTPESGYWRYNAASIAEAAILTGVESIPWAWTWNLGREDAFDNNDTHPNELGTNVIVNYIMRYMLGAYNGRQESFVWRPQQNPAEFVLTVDASAGTISYGLSVASNVTPASYTDVSGLPMWAWNSSDGTNQGQSWVAAVTNSATNTTLFKIGTDGHFGWQGYTTNPTATPNGLAGAQLTRAW